MNKIKIVLFLLLSIFVLSGTATATGFTVKSISQIGIISNVDSLNSANVTIDLVSNGGGQVVSGTWQSLNGLNLSQPFELQLSNRKEQYTYPIQNQGALYKFDSYYVDRTGFWSGATCPEKPAYCFPILLGNVEGVGVDRYLVVEKVDSGSYGLFGNGERSSSQDISISINGSQYSKKIGSGDARGAIQLYDSSGEWIANAQFVGASISGQVTPNQNNYVATQHGTGWKIAPSVDLDAYRSSLTRAETSLQNWQDSQGPANSWDAGYDYKKWPCQDTVCSTILNLINEHNANLEKLTSKNVKIDYGSPTSEPQTTIEAGNIIDIIDRDIAYDEIVLTMRASKIGILVSAGKPVIENVEVFKCVDGDANCYLEVGIKNSGDQEGTFGVRTNGSNEQRISIGTGDTGKTTLFFNNPTQGNYDGMVEVYDINSGETTTKNYNLTVLAPKTYIPNQETVNNKVIMLSDSTGMQNNEKETCSKGVFEWINGSYECKQLENIKDPADVQKEKTSILSTNMESKEPPKKENSGGTSFYEWLLLISIIGGFVLFILEKIINRQSRGLKRKNLIGAGTIVILVLALCVLLIIAQWPRIESWGNEIFVNLINDKMKGMIKT